jgi:hypothetical protein
MLQHKMQSQPRSPFSAINTVKLLEWQVSASCEEKRMEHGHDDLRDTACQRADGPNEGSKSHSSQPSAEGRLLTAVRVELCEL